MKIDLTTFLPYQLTHLATQLSNDFSSIYKKECDLTIPQWRIMANLAQSGQSTAKQLCIQADMDKSTVSRAVKTLIDEGLIYSELNKYDKRAAFLMLTDKGMALYEKITPQALQWECELLSCLSDDEQRQLIAIFDKLKNKLQA